MAVRARQPDAVGIRRTDRGWRAWVRVGGVLYSKRFPPETLLGTMKAWRQDARTLTRVTARIEAEAPGEPFEVDAATYLAAVASMPSIVTQRLRIQSWAQHFAGRPRASITPLEIRTRLEHLLAAGYSPSTVNKYRTALQALYTRLNGKAGDNPVRDVERYQETAEPRAQTFWTIYRILALMPPSQTRARLRVMLWTGWPQQQLAQLRPEHLDLDRARAYVTPRKKGRGRAGRWLPLLPGAVTALRDFVQWDCFTPTIKGRPRPFSRSAMHSSFARALAKLNARRARYERPPLAIRPYDLRHTFGTMLAERLQDDRAIQELMLHSRAEQTRRYTEAATAGRVQAAIASLSELPGNVSPRSDPAKAGDGGERPARNS